MSAAADPIRIVAALVGDAAGRALLVRKHGSSSFIQPGGKREPGLESPHMDVRALARDAHTKRRLGEFEHDAVNEAGRRVRAEVFAVRLDGAPQAQAEIAELAWVPARPPYPVAVAPLSAVYILPLLAGA